MHEADAWAREVPLIALDDALAHYEEHGYARLGQVLPDRMRAALVARADDLMLGRVTHEGLFFQHDAESGRYHDLAFGAGYVGPSLRYRKIEKLEKDPIFRAWIENPLFERIARARIEGDLAIYRAAMFGKAASGSSALPFHQDGGSFWGLSRDPELQIWTALDDAGEDAGCLEVVPGSHRFGLATPLGGLIPEHVVARREIRAFYPAPTWPTALLRPTTGRSTRTTRTARTTTARRVAGFGASRSGSAARGSDSDQPGELADIRGTASPGMTDEEAHP